MDGERLIPGRFPFAVLLLFVGSGCAALIYEVVWFHLLRLVIGASSISLGMLLASFMGGMCIGSLAYARWVSVRRHPLRVYAALELCIGLIGLALPLLLPTVSQLYGAVVRPGESSVAVRAIVAALLLLPPTILMGATLPAIGRWVQATPEGMSRLGYFYGANIIGAVAGCLLAGFYLLPLHDMQVATYTAAAINAAVALTAVWLARGSSYRAGEENVLRPSPPKVVAASPAVHAAIALSGLSALGAEVVWTRLLSLLLGVTVYAFSIILAVFLAGLGIGSSVGAALIRRIERPRLAFATCQLLLVGAIWLGAFLVTQVVAYWPPPKPEAESGMFVTFAFDMFRCAVALLPATILWGASFPLALASTGLSGRDPGRIVGRLYAANTIGAIAGSLLFSFLVIPQWGTRQAQAALAVVAGLAALLMFRTAWSSAAGERAVAGQTAGREESRESGNDAGNRDFLEFVRTPLAAVVTGTAVVLAVLAMPQVPVAMYAIGRKIAWPEYESFPRGYGRPLFLDEGVTTPVMVWENRGQRSLRLSGKSVASDHPFDMWLQRTLGNLPALVHPDPRSALIVGMGAGVTAGSFVVHPEIERIVICEIEPRVADAAGQFFAEANHHVLTDPRTRVVYDDGRHFLSTTREKFDIITSDPLHPYVRGAATLYSVEYYELCKRHLNPGGVCTQWIPMYETNEAAVKSQLAAFFAAFPDGTLWHANMSGKGYDLVALGQVDPPQIDFIEIQQRLDRNPRLQESLDEVAMGSAAEILDTFVGRGGHLTNWLESAEINRDANLRLEYLAGLSLDVQNSTDIYSTILDFREYPEDVIVAPPEVESRLRERFQDEVRASETP